MTAELAANQLSDNTKTNPQMKVLHEQLLRLVKECLGGNGLYGTTITIASGVATIVDGYSIFTLDTEGSASSDDLTSVATAGTFHDGQLIGFKIANAGRLVTYKNAAALAMRDGADYTPTSTSEIVWFRYVTGVGLSQIMPDSTTLLSKQFGAKALSTVTMASNAITPTRPAHKVDTSGAASEDLNLIGQSGYSDGDKLWLVNANSARVPTIKHNQSGTGKVLMADSADFYLRAGDLLVLEKSGTTWVEVFRSRGSLIPDPSTGSAGQYLKVNSSTNGYELGTGAGGWTVSTQSGDFTISSITDKTRYVITASSAVTVTITAASPADNLTEIEMLRASGSGLISIVYSGAAAAASNKTKAPDGDYDTYEMPAGVINRLNMLAVSGGWSV